MINGSTLVNIGFFVVVTGILIIFLGSMIQSTSSENTKESSNSEIKTGGVILIGPIPIIFGNDKNMLVTSVILGVILMLVAYFLFYRH
ncbi:MAG: TIGR00304 family protein [Methanobacteriaceae archaeon]|nr:TIGR00304 family protein [Methanobacteriaceae archaeon]